MLDLLKKRKKTEFPEDVVPELEAPEIALEQVVPEAGAPVAAEEAVAEGEIPEAAVAALVPEDHPAGVETDVKTRKKKRTGTIVRRCLLSFGSVLLLLIGGLYGVVALLNYGPSKTARDLFVLSALESSAGDFLATMFFSKEELDAIVMGNSIVQTDDVTDTTLVDVTENTADKSKIELIDVSGSTYKGKLMIVHDPSRVVVGISGAFGPEAKGKEVKDMVKAAGAVAGVNAGGFEDIGGVGSGGQPLGIVIKEGQLKCGALSRTYEVIGFDNKNKMVVGNMTAQKALDMGIRDAVSFGPILVVNGKPCEISGTGGGLNPRTAIGQRKDGAVLILVIDGRQVSSLGANYRDLVNIMVEYGAVNAANLDGGMSSHMVYEGKIITNPSSLYGTRPIPTSILVK